MAINAEFNMLIRCLMITVFVLQGLWGSVLAAPFMQHSAGMQNSVASDTEAATASAMADCHGRAAMVQSEATAPHEPTPSASEHCAGVCCCPGMCSAAPVLASELPMLLPAHAQVYQTEQPLDVIARPSELYRPPSLI